MFRLVFLGVYTYACTLCPLRVPPRPRPLDQMYCELGDARMIWNYSTGNISRSLKVEEQCRAGFENIFCTTDSMLDSLSCTGSENPSRCSECAHNWVANKWTITCTRILPYIISALCCCVLLTHLFREKKFNGQYCRMELEVPDAQSSKHPEIFFMSFCIDFGYVISLEAQFFIILIMLIYYARSHLFYSKVVAWSFILFSVVLTFYRTYSAGLPPAPLLTAEPIPLEITIAMLESVIISPFTRLSPYMVGFLFGIRMWNENGIKKDDIYNKMITFFASLLTVFSAIFVLFSLLPFATSSAGHPLFLSFYSAFHRPLWSFSLLSFLYLCHHGSFAWINAFLTWRIFSPLSKLSWIALIVAEPIILYFFTALNRPSYATNWSTIYASVSAATMSYLVALTIDIFLARPIRLLVNREELHGYRQPNT
uniref:Transmembrane protein n=1 Tax=Heterorhabditis bacteriophora TaxID=37862 RepID=A0A1I7X2R0_HETBA